MRFGEDPGPGQGRMGNGVPIVSTMRRGCDCGSDTHGMKADPEITNKSYGQKKR
jgi:hypothetical protein